MTSHIPVLLNEVISFLDPKPGEFFIDGTLNGGGHAAEIFRRISPDGTLLGVDWDQSMLETARQNISTISKSENLISKLILVNDNFKNMKTILEKENLGKADGLILDLGFSSEQIENSGRGFSFQKDEPLHMTYARETKPVYEWLHDLRELELAKIIKDFSGERNAPKIAKAIKKNLPIRTTGKLARLIRETVPKNYERGRLDPATRTFQALRIFANHELENLKIVLSDLMQILNPGGRVTVISFHSLEDRIAKQSFRSYELEGKIEILTKKPIVPTEEEIKKNPKSRSAKLRAVRVL